ncbi:MAG: RluA family pseudouridine synthase [Planctomycetes bacterium]|nr:RluA family pseudouridine synthase [Planctomycetota bacterium]
MLDVIYEDNHLLVVNKPAGLATQGALPGHPSLVDRARRDVKDRYHKPGNVYIGVVSRLDALVSGVVVLARTSKAAARLNEQFREGAVDKIYWALVSPRPVVPKGTWRDWLRENDAAHRVEIAPDHRGAKEGVLEFAVRGEFERGAWLEIVLETGRKHQIRAQCAHHGCPILGDVKYGSRVPFPNGIALHARILRITHPTRGDRLEFKAPLPATWKALDGPFRDPP